MSPLTVPIVAAVAALALVALLGYGLVTVADDTSLDESVRRSERPVAPSDSERFVAEHDVTYPIVRDVGSELSDEYGTRRLPETFVLDRAGRIVDLRRGQVDQAWLDQALRKALAGSA